VFFELMDGKVWMKDGKCKKTNFFRGTALRGFDTGKLHRSH
jgi:hypothetical protein